MMKNPIQDKKQQIKQLIEELNYRTEQRAVSELIELSQSLHSACIELKVMEELADSMKAENKAHEVTASVRESAPRTKQVLPNEAIIEEMVQLSREKLDIQEEGSQLEEEEYIEREVVIEEVSSSGADAVEGHEEHKTDLNKRLTRRIVVDFNDRFAFVNKLFEGNQEDFNSVISQLNTMGTFKEAVNFIDNIVKPDYNWKGKEEFEERFLALIERHLSE